MFIKLDYRRAEQKKCFHPPSLSSDKNAGKSVAWSTTLRECGRGCGAAGVRGKINAENEIHPLIMDGRGRGRRRRQRQIPTAEEGEREREVDHKRWREMSPTERKRDAQNGHPRRRLFRKHRKTDKNLRARMQTKIQSGLMTTLQYRISILQRGHFPRVTLSNVILSDEMVSSSSSRPPSPH